MPSERALDGWDIHEIAYNTGLLPDVRGLWAADPDIPLLSTYLRSRARLEPLDGYASLAIVAHSMGGLVVQRAFVDDPELVGRVSHVFMFGTPSGGLRSGKLGRFFKRQIADMAFDGEFIRDLRERWDEQIRRAGVPSTSGLSPATATSSSRPAPRSPRSRPRPSSSFPATTPRSSTSRAPGTMSEQVIAEGLIGSAAPAGPWNSARVAVERREFARAIDELLPNAEKLDERHLVELALALDSNGRRDEAVDVLERTSSLHGTDVKGTLAGRRKRNVARRGTARGRRGGARALLAEPCRGAERR